MGQTLLGAVKVQISHTYVNALDLGNVTDSVSKTYTNSLTNGTGANKVQQAWHDKRSLLTTANEELDLTALAAGAFGTVNFSKIKSLVIAVITATSGYRLEIGGAAANAFSDFVKDPSDIMMVHASGTIPVINNPVTGSTVDATHKMLKITNPSGGTVEYEIWIVGEGALA